MTRDHFNKSRRESYSSSPTFINTKSYQIEKKVEDTIGSIWYRIFSIPRRFLQRAFKK